MSDLSRFLLNAATAAVGDTTCEHMRHFGQVDCDPCSARAATAAVLEALAAHYEGYGVLMGAGGLRKLAAEVEEDRNGE